MSSKNKAKSNKGTGVKNTPEVKAPEVKAPEVKAPEVKAEVKAPAGKTTEGKIEADRMSKECKEKVKEFFEAHEGENDVYVTADGTCFLERDRSYAVDHKNKLELEMFQCKRTK